MHRRAIAEAEPSKGSSSRRKESAREPLQSPGTQMETLATDMLNGTGCASTVVLLLLNPDSITRT